MAIETRDPNTVVLSGPLVRDNEYTAGAAITPGHVIELYDDSGTTKWRVHATGTEVMTPAVAEEQRMMNKTVDDAYAADDLVEAAFLQAGAKFWALIPSGQTISNGEFLQSNGDGTLVTASATTADANLARFQSLENLGTINALTRCIVQVI